MPRLHSTKKNTLISLQEKLYNTYKGTSLEQLIQLMIESVSSKDSQLSITYFENIINSLPTREEVLSDRFIFDSLFLNELKNSIFNDIEINSKQLIPKYSDNWGYVDAKGVNLIHIKHGDLNLLEYTWIMHEIGHFYFNINTQVISDIQSIIDNYIKDNKFQILSLKGAMKQTLQSTIDVKTIYWYPTLNQKNWSHEILMDIFGFFVCGKSYIDTFIEFLQESGSDPYFLNQEHPPYDTRLQALMITSQKCSVDIDFNTIETIKNKWDKKFQKSNEFEFYSDKYLINDLVDYSISTFRENKIPFCNDVISLIENKIIKNRNIHLGYSTLIEANIIYNTKGHDEYIKWQDYKYKRVVNNGIER